MYFLSDGTVLEKDNNSVINIKNNNHMEHSTLGQFFLNELEAIEFQRTFQA
jgi:hypothetical protein